jgi:hypothetical protein
MATWREVRCWLESRSVTFVGGEEWAGVCWPPDGAGLGKTTVVNVVHEVIGPEQRLVASAHVAAEELVSVQAFLRWNGRLRAGGLVFQRGEVFVRRTFPLEALTLEQLGNLLTHLAHDASLIRADVAPIQDRMGRAAEPRASRA